MLQRYDYEDKRAFGSTDNNIRIYDRQHGVGRDSSVVAICTDKDQAQRIVDLLNASDEKRKEPK